MKLSKRARKIIAEFGGTKEKIRKAIESGVIDRMGVRRPPMLGEIDYNHATSKYRPNYGKKTAEELFNWAGLMISSMPQDSRSFQGLSVRTRNGLLYAGIETKKQLIEALKMGRLKYKKMKNFGKKSYKEACDFVSFKEPERTKSGHLKYCPHCGEKIV